jgi:hypothetical protein
LSTPPQKRPYFIDYAGVDSVHRFATIDFVVSSCPFTIEMVRKPKERVF